jgi:malate dehydrogenase (oxaloacetate-decarboxylating)(NADP+)
VQYDGKTLVPGQGNNVYIFPAMGMAVYATEAKRVTDEMFITAARAVAEQVTDANLETGLIYPPLSEILPTSLHVALRVAETIFDAGLAEIERPPDLKDFIERMAYRPQYRSLV